MSGTDAGVLVVGAGLAGLSAALELARTGRPVTLIERLPAFGGQAGFEDREVRRLHRECAAAGVRFLLGSTALRWSDRRLLVVGPGQATWLDGSWLVFAGGSRPATPAERGILGGRPAGVFAATVAHHLLEAGIVLGRRVVVAGGGDWAGVVVPELRHSGARVTVVGARYPSGPGIRYWPGHRPIEVHGLARVNRVTVTDGRSLRNIACDAVVLAGELRPLRNVDGAVRDGADGATFIQPTRNGMDHRAVIDFARTEAARALVEMGAGN